MKILMVCLGNICRSPLAEGILKHKATLAELGWKIDSAGTNGFHVGESPHQLSQKVARLHGIDISTQVARQFIADDINNFDLIYAMAEDVLEDIKNISGEKFQPQKVKLYLEELFPGTQRDVPDPWYGTEAGYHEVYDLLNKTADIIIKKYAPVLSSQDI